MNMRGASVFARASFIALAETKHGFRANKRPARTKSRFKQLAEWPTAERFDCARCRATSTGLNAI